MLQNALHSSQGLDHVRAVVVEIPQLAIMSLVGPPEGVLLQNLGGGRGEGGEGREGRVHATTQGSATTLAHDVYMYMQRQMRQPMHMAWQLCTST